MTPEEVKKIIREELSELIKSDRFTFYKTIQILDGRNIIIGQTTGTMIGTENTQKIGFWNTTPAVQPTATADPTGGTTQDLEARQAISNIIDKLQSIGILDT